MQLQSLTIFEIWQAVLTVWLLALSFFIFQAVNHYKKLTRGSGNLNLSQILEGIVAKQDQVSAKINQVAGDLTNEKNDAKTAIKKYSLLRFNPFEDAGGDQSFVVTLLNAKNNGFLISSLHSRSGTRVYAKEVTEGKSTHKLSKEEREAIDKALKS